jgi:anti-anti-sigma regulatory factor
VLKISIVDTPTHRRLLLEGQLVDPWTVELKSTCEEAKANLQTRKLVIDLRCLTAISQEGEEVLLQLLSEGIKFQASGAFTKFVMKQLSQKQRNLPQEKKR